MGGACLEHPQASTRGKGRKDPQGLLCLPGVTFLSNILGRWSGKTIPRPHKALTQKKKTPRMSVMKEALSRGSGPEAEKLPGASKSTGGLAKMQIPGPHSRALIL